MSEMDKKEIKEQKATEHMNEELIRMIKLRICLLYTSPSPRDTR